MRSFCLLYAPETARAIATGVGGVNAMLETLQLDELLKAYTILDKAGADDTLLNLLVREVTKRSLDTAVETGQEDLQELATIAGVQLGSKIDTGEWVYSFADMVRRVWDTTKESVLTFGLTNLPSIVNNVIQQSQYSGNMNGISFPEQEAQLRHIFRNKTGHIEDTSENRRKILEVTGNKRNYLGKDSRGNDWYAVTLEDGRQMWVRTRNGIIDNAGINDAPRIWDSETGLYNNTKRE